MTTGVTFTFGGLKVAAEAEVDDLYGGTIPGLYAAGEMVGGLYLPELRQRHRPDVGRHLRPARRRSAAAFAEEVGEGEMSAGQSRTPAAKVDPAPCRFRSEPAL